MSAPAGRSERSSPSYRSLSASARSRGSIRSSLGISLGPVTRLTALAALALMAAPTGTMPLPNLVEAPPQSLGGRAIGDRGVLRFPSTVENAGGAPLVVVSTRTSPSAPFRTVQLLGARQVPGPVTPPYPRAGGPGHTPLLG